jgi:hypothetical protein
MISAAQAVFEAVLLGFSSAVEATRCRKARDAIDWSGRYYVVLLIAGFR